MATKINGATQIQPATIPLSALVTNYQIPTGNLVQGSLFVQSNGSVQMTGTLNLGGTVPTNAGTPTNASDIVTKSYVDGKIQGLTFHQAVRALANSNVSISSPGTSIDGVTLATNDRILLVAQSTGSQNGPWVFQGSSAALIRPSDWASASTQSEGAYFLTDPDGTTFKNTKWYMSNTSAITVDTTATTWSQDLSGTAYTGGNGITLTGTSFAANLLAAGGLVFNGAAIAVNADTTRGGTVSASGVGVVDGSTGGMVALTNSSNHFTWTTLSGDVTVASSGATTVNNTSGSGFVKYTNFVFNETPSGSINGSNTSFSLANTPANSSADLMLVYNGDVLKPGTGNDFTISGAAITTLFVPQTGDSLLAFYLK